MSKESLGHATGSVLGRSIGHFTDGKSPVKDTAVGAGIFTAGLLLFAGIVSAPITLSALAASATIGGGIGLTSGMLKKRDREKK